MTDFKTYFMWTMLLFVAAICVIMTSFAALELYNVATRNSFAHVQKQSILSAENAAHIDKIRTKEQILRIKSLGHVLKQNPDFLHMIALCKDSDSRYCGTNFYE